MEKFLIVKGADRGNMYFNMACDEFLLRALSIAEGHGASGFLRNYSWEGSCVSIGYTQSYHKLIEEGIMQPAVRRPTGGGVVFHGDDFTYSLVIFGSSKLFSLGRKELYIFLHSSIMKTLQEFGISSELCNSDKIVKGYYRCFRNPVYGDLLLFNGSKIAGAAMKCMKDRILIQGSVEIIKTGIGFEEFKKKFNEVLSKSANVIFEDYFLEEEDYAEIRNIERNKYMLDIWNKERRL